VAVGTANMRRPPNSRKIKAGKAPEPQNESDRDTEALEKAAPSGPAGARGSSLLGRCGDLSACARRRELADIRAALVPNSRTAPKRN
jgi:hypothetical protein